MVKKLVFTLIAAAMAANNAFATQDTSMVSSVVVTKNKSHLQGSETKEVFLMPVKLTEKQLQSLNNFKSKSHNFLKQTFDLPSNFDVGMNNVPVLDQGRHGSCVTFATTAAIDALIGKGDYVSQLCQLELGSYLEKEGYFPSGWMGSNSNMVLNQIEQFGLVSKEKQSSGLCAGVKEYPLKDQNNEGHPVTVEEYKSLSETLNTPSTFFVSDPLLTLLQRFYWDNENLGAEKTLIKIKQFLLEKDEHLNMRLIFGTILPVNYCSAGACATFHGKDDTWALTEAMKNDQHMTLGGHEMIITGYDDNAVAIDRDGNKHQGLLTLRNSWGDDVGDNGNYYMTYDFFKAFVMDIQKLYFLHDVNQSK